MRRVLFVDDEPSVLEAQRRVWRTYRSTWQIDTADGGAEAIERLKAQAYDAVVSDARMPSVSGEQVLRAAQKLQPTAIRIVLSGQIDQKTGSTLAAVAHQFLLKPSSAAAVLAAINEACAVRETLTSPAVQALVVGVGALAIAPKTYHQLVAELESPSTSVDSLCAVVEQSPTVCAAVLRLVSSAFFGLPRKVWSLREAVVLLGADVLRQAVLAAEVFQGPDPLGIVETTLRSSIECASVARHLGPPGAAVYLASESALMADIGVSLLSQHCADTYAPLWKRARSHAELVELEREAYGANHAAIGAAFLALWNLPPALVAAVAQHHQHPAHRLPDTSAVVHLATLLTEEANAHVSFSVVDGVASHLGLEPQVAKIRGERMAAPLAVG